MIKNSSVAGVDVVEGGDEVCEDRSFDRDPSGGSFGLQQVDGPQDRGPGGLVRRPVVQRRKPDSLVRQEEAGLHHRVVVRKPETKFLISFFNILDSGLVFIFQVCKDIVWPDYKSSKIIRSLKELTDLGTVFFVF